MDKYDNLRITVLGLRSLSGACGGVESHCEHLYAPMAAAGADVEVLVRSAYESRTSAQAWKGVRIRRLWSPKWTGVETVVHTFLGVTYAAVRRPDVLHLHGIGPALFTPMARMLGLHVIVTWHAPDYLQAKWGRFGKWLLRTGERMAMRHANEVICVSRHGATELARVYGRTPVLIPNGVPAIDPAPSHPVLAALGIEPGRFVLHVGRAIPDKRQDDLVRAFGQAGLPGWKLVLVGDLSGRDPYSTRLRTMAGQRPDVVMTGIRRGAELHALFANCGCFALPSAVEGFPIALLEALSAGRASVASNIPANHEIELPDGCYFDVGDIASMAAAVSSAPVKVPRDAWVKLQARIRADHDWRRIADRTARLYVDSLRRSPQRPRSAFGDRL